MARAASEQRVEDEGFLGNGKAAVALTRARSGRRRDDVLAPLLLVRLVVRGVERSLLGERRRRGRNGPGRDLAGGGRRRGIRRRLERSASATAGEPERQNGRRETDE